MNPRNLSSLVILAALCVGGTAQAQSRGECKSESKAQCANVELEWLDWRGANLAGANFDGANLEFANLANADLRGASFRGANLKWSSLSGADLRGANFDQADMQSVNLESANMAGAALRGAKLRKVASLIWKRRTWEYVAEVGTVEGRVLVDLPR